jgi:tetratricopeptide (TPR) repeat protein
LGQQSTVKCFAVFYAGTALLAAGCANPINEATWHRYTAAGNAAKARGDLGTAEEAHRRAVINDRVGNLGAEHEALALHNLALVKRDLCKLDEAEESLRRAYELRDKNPDTPPRNLTGTIVELAQLYYEQRRYADVAPLMERGLPLLVQLDVERVNPATFAHVLVEYADTLRNLNRTTDADNVDARVTTLVSARGIDMQQRPNRPPFDHPPCR